MHHTKVEAHDCVIKLTHKKIILQTEAWQVLMKYVNKHVSKHELMANPFIL